MVKLLNSGHKQKLQDPLINPCLLFVMKIRLDRYSLDLRTAAVELFYTRFMNLSVFCKTSLTRHVDLISNAKNRPRK
jgi:hypothetical protein